MSQRSPLRLVVNKVNATENNTSPTPVPTQAEQVYTEALYRKYRQQVLSYLERRLPSKEDAQELLQETYIKLLRRGSLEDLERNAKGYLFTIARNLVIDKLRAENMQNSFDHKDLQDVEIGSDSEAPHLRAEWTGALQQLKNAINDLPPRVQQVFVLHRFNNLTYAEIATALGVTTRTVERDMSTAMALVGQRLTEFL